MNEKEFVEIAKRYLKGQGYEIVSLIRLFNQKWAKAYGVDLTNRDYAVARMKKGDSTPDYVILFVKDNSLGKLSAGSYPDIVAIRNGKPFMFEVKTYLDDRWIGQCLRYLTAYPFFGEITVIVPEGFADGWLKVISKFKLPIKAIQLGCQA